MTHDHFSHISSLTKKATYASVFIVSFLIVIKFSAWFWTNSLSLQAAFIDSVLDGAASVINLFAVHHAYRPPDKEHRFGHGKIEAIAALGQSVFISISSLWLFKVAIDRFIYPEKLQATDKGITLLIIASCLTFCLLLYQKYIIRQTNSAAIIADSIHYQADLLINLSAIASLFAAQYFHISFLDPILGLGIAIYIFVTAWQIAQDSFQILIDRELSDDQREKICEIVLTHPKVLSCQDLKTRSSGSHHFIQLQIETSNSLSLKEFFIIQTEVKTLLKKSFPQSEIILQLSNPDPITSNLII